MKRLTFLILAFLCLVCVGHNSLVYAAFTNEELESIHFAARVSGATYARASDTDTLLVSGEHYNKMKTGLKDEVGVKLRELTAIGPDRKVAHTIIALKDTDAYIAFPGRTDGMSGTLNIIFGRKNTSDMPWECHGGILPYYVPLKEQLLAELQKLQDDGIKRFFFTGHCSGGGKASLAMASFLAQKDLPENISVRLITFALVPAVFQSAGVTEITRFSQWKGHHNIWLENDLWRSASAWLDWWKGNGPFGERIIIQPASKVSLVDSHRLSTYIAAFEKMMKEE